MAIGDGTLARLTRTVRSLIAEADAAARRADWRHARASAARARAALDELDAEYAGRAGEPPPDRSTPAR